MQNCEKPSETLKPKPSSQIYSPLSPTAAANAQKYAMQILAFVEAKAKLNPNLTIPGVGTSCEK